LNWLDPTQYIGIVPDDYLNACPQDGDSEAAAIANSFLHPKLLEIKFSKWLKDSIASSYLLELRDIEKPNSYYPKFLSFFHGESYGH